MIDIARLPVPVVAHGEGPVWDERSGRLHWVDMVNGTVHHVDPQKPERQGSTRIGPWVAALRPRERGGWVVATDAEFLLTDASFVVEHRIPVVDDARLRMNDGGCAPDGSFLCGTAGPGSAGSLYRLAPDLDVSVVTGDVAISNGIAADPRGDGVFYVDTLTRRIDRLRLVDGVLRERVVFADLTTRAGLPDGIAVDAEGGVWVAMWGAGEVIRVDERGEVSDRIAVPTSHVSACAFGGADLSELYITTSSQDLPAPEPAAGALFVARPGVRGLRPVAFGG